MSDKKPVIAMIAAMGLNRAIGVRNALPWHIPEDFKHFKSTTLGKPIIMGRKTFQALSRPLPGRTNIVITRQKDYAPEGVVVTHGLEEAIEIAIKEAKENNVDEIMVIGGGQIYEQALPMADRIYLTHVDKDVKEADAFFPEFDAKKWDVTRHEPHTGHAYGQPDFIIVTYERKI